MSSVAAQRRLLAKQERRASILAAATRIFSDRGLAAATMDEVAREAGVSKGALYLYFESKDELYLEIAISTLSQVVEKMEATLGQAIPTGAQRLRELVLAYVDCAVSDRGRFSAGIGWLTTNYAVDEHCARFPLYRGLIERALSCCAQAVAHGQEDGSLAWPGDPRRVALQIWGAALGVLLVEHSSNELERRVSGLPELQGMTTNLIDRLLGLETITHFAQQD